MEMINVKNFAKSFDKKVVHKDVSFQVQRGECMGLIGGSGVGKSIILRSLIGLEKPDSGTIKIEGEEISNYSEQNLIDIRKKVAYAFQGGALFDSMSVYDNLAYPLRAHTKLSESEIAIKIKEQLEEFGLSGNEKIFPSELSGGMQKRLGIARAIIIGPEIILYDEPTAGLDPFNTQKIQHMILRLKEKKVTSILVTHDMPTAIAVCDRIALLSQGKIIAKGTYEDMKNDPKGLLNQFTQGLVD